MENQGLTMADIVKQNKVMRSRLNEVISLLDKFNCARYNEGEIEEASDRLLNYLSWSILDGWHDQVDRFDDYLLEDIIKEDTSEYGKLYT